MTNNQPARDMFAGHPGGTHEDLLAGGYSFTALKGVGFMEPEVIAIDAGRLALAGVDTDPK